MTARTRRRCTTRGFTIIELMISCILLVIFCTVAVQMGARIHRERDIAQRYAADLRELRAALRTIAGDVRAARDVARTEDSLVLALEDGAVRYSMAADALMRTGADGSERRLARSVASLQSRVQGSLVTLQLRLRRRSESTVAAAAVSTQVRRRRVPGEGR